MVWMYVRISSADFAVSMLLKIVPTSVAKSCSGAQMASDATQVDTRLRVAATGEESIGRIPLWIEARSRAMIMPKFLSRSFRISRQ